FTSYDVASDTVIWISDASGDWSNGANWNTGQVPGVGQNVLINRIGANPLVTYSVGTLTVNSLKSEEPFSMTGGALTVTGTSRITQAFNMSGGTLIARGASFTASGATSISGGELQALNGGTIDLPLLTTYDLPDVAFQTRTWKADGAGSVLS